MLFALLFLTFQKRMDMRNDLNVWKWFRKFLNAINCFKVVDKASDIFIKVS